MGPRVLINGIWYYASVLRRGFFLGESRCSSRRLRLKSNRLRRFRAEPFYFRAAGFRTCT